MANEIVQSTTVLDQETYIHAKLLQRSYLKLVAASLCDKVNLPKGHGDTAHFVRYRRMNVPLAPLTENTEPANSSFALEEVTVTLDQWGDVITLTDRALLTTRSPLLQQALELLADNAQRVIDREVQIVMLAGTNVQYGNATVTTRATVTAAMTITDAILHRARITLSNAGAPPRDGPGNAKENAKGGPAQGSLTGGRAYVGVCGPEVMADLMSIAAASGLWAAVSQYQNAKAVYTGEVGTFLGIRWVETNFIPKFEILGNTTEAAAAGADAGGITGLTTAVANHASGALANSTTYYWKVTRKDLTRGFEEDISIRHSTATGAADDSMSFTMPSTAGYAYNVYFGDTNADADLFLVGENQAPSAVVTVLAVPTSGDSAPANVNPTLTPDIHPVYILGADVLNWVGLQNLETYITKDEATTDNPLKLRRKVGYKFMAKAMIKDQTRMLRLELASAFS